jgi:hypothetical protein
MRILRFVALIFSAPLAACASEISNPLMGGFFVDPGKYEFYSCEQIAANRLGAIENVFDRWRQWSG